MENIKIDTALLSEVLEDVNEVFEISEIVNNSINVWYYPTDERGKSNQRFRKVNIDTLARLMKEWCLKHGKGYTFSKTINKEFLGYQCFVSIENIGEAERTSYNSEFEAVYKATEYVYKQVKGK